MGIKGTTLCLAFCGILELVYGNAAYKVTLEPKGVINEHKYIVCEEGMPMEIYCNIDVTGYQRTVTMYLDDVIVIHENMSPNRLKYEFTPKASDHFSIVKCLLENGTLKIGEEELQLFVTKCPKDLPKLVIPTIMKLGEGNISCSTREARPPLDMYISVNDTPIDIEETVLNGINGYATTAAVASEIDSTWNGQSVDCCFNGSHCNTLCSPKQYIVIKYPPISIDIMQEINIDDIQIVSFLTKLSCNVSAANQQCNISWDHSNLYLSEDQAITGNETDGFYTKADIILNVSRSSGAHNVTCNAHCGEFNEVSRSLQLKIPTCYRMKEIIELSQKLPIKNVSETYVITTVFCKMSASETPCTIIWDHSFITVFENQTDSGDRLVGYCTESYIILNVSRLAMTKTVKCTSQCGNLNVTSRSLHLEMPIFHEEGGALANRPRTIFDFLKFLLSLIAKVTIIVAVVGLKKRFCKKRTQTAVSERHNSAESVSFHTANGDVGNLPQVNLETDPMLDTSVPRQAFLPERQNEEIDGRNGKSPRNKIVDVLNNMEHYPDNWPKPTT